MKTSTFTIKPSVMEGKAIVSLIIYGKPPSKSNNYHSGRYGQFYKDPKVKQYEMDFAKQIKARDKNKFPDKTRLWINIDWFTDSFRADIDGINKVIFDCLQKNGVIINDNRVDRLTEKRYIDKDCCRVEICICEI